jgi:uncharacterized membrane protein
LTDSDETFQDNPESFPASPAHQPQLPTTENPGVIEEVRRVIREDPDADSETILRRITSVVAEYTSGPLPPPSMLKGYEDVLPGAADRIFTLMEQQSAHRQELERTTLDRNSRARDRGQLFAFILCALVIVGGFVAIYLGQSLVGMAAIIIAVGGVAATFLTTRQRQQQQLEERREAVPGDQGE